jgi:hypothetical protein
MTEKDSLRLSQILPRLADGQEENLTVEQILARMQGRAHTALLVLFALPNTLPSIPGTSALTGIPLVYLSIQMMLGKSPWLPGFIMKRTFPRASLAAIMEKVSPWLQRGERYLHPRLGILTSPSAERVVGILMTIMALAVLMPIPFGNMLPSLAIIFFAIGLMEEDGAWILLGIATMILGIVIFSTVLWGLFKAAIFVFLGAFGLQPL